MNKGDRKKRKDAESILRLKKRLSRKKWLMLLNTIARFKEQGWQSSRWIWEIGFFSPTGGL